MAVVQGPPTQHARLPDPASLSPWAARRGTHPPGLTGRSAMTSVTCCAVSPCSSSRFRSAYHAFGLIGTALSKKIRIFQSSCLNGVLISPNAS